MPEGPACRPGHSEKQKNKAHVALNVTIIYLPWLSGYVIFIRNGIMRVLIILFSVCLYSTGWQSGSAAASEECSLPCESTEMRDGEYDFIPSCTCGILPVTRSPGQWSSPLADNEKPDSSKMATNKAVVSRDRDYWVADVFLGLTVNAAGDTTTPAASVGGELKFCYEDVIAGCLRGEFCYDLEDESTDTDKFSEWYIVSAEGEYYPLEKKIDRNGKKSTKLLTGLISRIEARDNTPSSEEHRLEALAGISCKYKGRTAITRGYLAYSITANEIDDDLPRSRGIDESRIRGIMKYFHGPALGADLEMQTNDYLKLFLGGRFSIDLKNEDFLGTVGSQAECNLSRICGFKNTPAICVVPFAEYRLLGEEFEKYTGFAHDTRGGLMLMARF